MLVEALEESAHKNKRGVAKNVFTRTDLYMSRPCISGSLTPAVRGDYAKHNCPLDQYVRQAADATMVGLRMILTGVALDMLIRAGARSGRFSWCVSPLLEVLHFTLQFALVKN